MTRIIAGALGGRRIDVPPGLDTRPTADRVREAVFSRLDHEGVVAGRRVLDLFAGSGALGLEAASRGAQKVVCVESANAAASVIRANIAALGVGSLVTLAAVPVRRFLSTPPAQPWDLVLMDPPYAMRQEDLGQVLSVLAEDEWLADDAIVVVERDRHADEPRWPYAMERYDERRYGQTQVWFAEVAHDETA